MNARQNAKFKMYRAVEQHCEDNKDVFKNLVAFNTAFNNFKAKIVEINSTSQQKNVVLTGIAKDKGNAKQNLAQMASDIAGEIFAFANERRTIRFTLPKYTRTRNGKSGKFGRLRRFPTKFE